jgi:hypothetical protein
MPMWIKRNPGNAGSENRGTNQSKPLNYLKSDIYILNMKSFHIINAHSNRHSPTPIKKSRI